MARDAQQAITNNRGKQQITVFMARFNLTKWLLTIEKVLDAIPKDR